ncbi:hypothetical protein MIS45_09730 [Wielerella bovis]|uniref:hypothetical protein n=1 Tax=Wielerella bovis TaxID=2917790 RepID=UPI002019B4C4|nr:hypothetical protein [Wielerella bovis]ULJ69022.1 hypothetical protein MIS45_09730 [Wielerella bovis]
MDYDIKDFTYSPSVNLWSGTFKENLGILSCSTHIEIDKMTFEEMQTNKPVYLGVMASMEQLQPILDNPHLFDAALLTAVNALKIQYQKIKIQQE